MFKFTLRILFVLGLMVALWPQNVNGQPAFTRPLTVPVLLDSSSYQLYADVETHDFGRVGYDNLTTFAYNHDSSRSNSYLGPTLTWRVGRTQTMHVTNRLGPNNTTTVHWHGADIPPDTDGGPHEVIPPGSTFSPSFVVRDAPCNLWYHPHADNLTYVHVQMGLAGLIIVKDSSDAVAPLLPNRYGLDDFPVIIQDIAFDSNGTAVDSLQAHAPRRMNIVNGTIQPYLKVPPQVVRFRVLDGSTAHSLMLMLVEDTTNLAVKFPFILLASDGGYLPDSVRKIDSLYTGPGIRNDILVDFTNQAGKSFYLFNRSESIPRKTVGAGSSGPNGNYYVPRSRGLMRIEVDSTQTLPLGTIPASLPAIAPLGTPDTTRTITLNGRGAGPTSTTPLADSLKFNINGKQYESLIINDTVMANTVEEWTIVNNSTVAHPFHIHLIQFFVTRVDSINGTPLPIPVEMLGPKDCIMVQSGQKVTFRAKFDSYASSAPFDPEEDTYMYHCHILTHEDGYYALGMRPDTLGGQYPDITQRDHWGMMQQFVVWNGITKRDFSQPLGENLILFPNPATEEINLNGECPKLSTVRIFDLRGKLLMEKLLPPFNGTVSLDVANLQSGMVVLEWFSPKGRFTKKVVLR